MTGTAESFIGYGQLSIEVTNMAEHKHGEMDISDHEKTFAGFVTFTTYTVIGILVFLVFLALVGT